VVPTEDCANIWTELEVLFFYKQQVPRVYNQNKYSKFQILSLYTEFTISERYL